MKIYGDEAFQPIAVDVKQVRDALDARVASDPTKVYEAPNHQRYESDGVTIKDVSCYYVHTDEESGEPEAPGCVIGCCLADLGVPLDQLSRYEGQTAYQILPQVLKFPANTVDEVDTLRGLLGYVQGRQDAGDPWATALRNGQEFYRL